jgi:succinoglycan biosynthesis protein ExoA
MVGSVERADQRGAGGANIRDLLPRVSVVMPCLNEERFVGQALGSILAGSWPRDRLEVIVVDGRSTDRTREVVGDVAALDSRVRLCDNPRRTTPAALNIGVRAARGEIIARVDAHTVYPPEYVAALVRALEESGADMVGGRSENVPSGGGAMSEALSIATGAAFGTASPFRYRRRSGPVDTVPFGCWRRGLFARVGLFDERLLRNQDNELASRILRRGGRVWQTADICVRYYNRATLPSLARHALATGMWNAFTQRLHPYTFRLRHFLPGLFFLGVMICALAIVAGALRGEPALAVAAALLLAPYVAACVGAAVWSATARRRFALWPLVAVGLASYHFTYGCGIAYGWLLVATGRWRARLGVVDAPRAGARP